MNEEITKRAEAYAKSANLIAKHPSGMPELLSAWMPRAKKQTDYSEQAYSLYFVFLKKGKSIKELEDAIEGAATEFILQAKDQAAAGNYIMRLYRNITLFYTMTNNVLMDIDAARDITDMWTDAEILDWFTGEGAETWLRQILECWERDKESGFIKVRDAEKRAAAQAGNYAWYIERLLKKLQQEPQQKAAAHPMSKEDKDVIARYLYTNYAGGGFVTDVQSIYELVSKPRGFKAAATRIKGLYDKHVCRHEKESGNRKDLLTWGKWLKMWGDAYGVTFPPYRFSQL